MVLFWSAPNKVYFIHRAELISVLISFRSIMSKIRLNVLLCLQAVVKVSTIYLHVGTRNNRTLILLYGIKAGKMKQILCSDYFVC